jgi:two-component system, NtrC family, response regulator AtoC
MGSGDSRPHLAGDATTQRLFGDEGWSVRARVQVFWDGGHAVYWLGPASEVSVGRSNDCDLLVDHASVSRRHALLRGGSPPTIVDLGSANGVRVRGARILPHIAVPIYDGEVVELGSTLLVVQSPPGAHLSVPPAPRSPVTEDASPMVVVARLLEAVAKSDLSVLLLGETGVGKTVAAQTIHRLSARSDRPFRHVNCPSFPDSLLESELFGHERGAFTGASHAKPGLIEAAEGGTVFLDEVGEMPMTTQAKLLSVVETREVLRLGSLTPRRIDVRFVSATNRDLEARVLEGAFRQDLFFRLDGLSIVIPPLRDRVGEVPEMARLFLEQACARNGRAPPRLSEDAVESLVADRWPGNLRELRNMMERAAVLCTDVVITAESLRVVNGRRSVNPLAPRSVARSTDANAGHALDPAQSLRDEIHALERQRIVQVLEQCQGNQTRAAALLGMSRRALITRLDTFQLPRPRKPRLPK